MKTTTIIFRIFPIIVLPLLSLLAASCANTGSTPAEKTTASSFSLKPETSVGGQQIRRNLTDADAMIHKKQYREAEILLTRVVQTDSDNFLGWQSLIAVHCGLTGEAIDSENWLAAGHHLDWAQLALDKVKSLAIAPGSQIAPETVVKLENQMSEMQTNVQSSIDVYCNGQLEEADYWAYKAIDHPIHWIGPNNRNEIVLALQSLKPVVALKSWTSDSVRMHLTSSYLKCKKAVSSNEWTGLLARAGLQGLQND